MTLSNLNSRGTIKGTIYRGGGGGITDYNALSGKPLINNNIVEGNHDGSHYGLVDSEDIDVTEIYEIGYGSNYDINLIGANVYVTNKIFHGATASNNGDKGLVPAPAAGSAGKILSNEGWIDPPSSLTNYSTTAHKTGRKWIDGKDVWEQTFTGTLTSSSQTLTLGDLDYTPETIINQYGNIYYQQTNQWLHIPYANIPSSGTVAIFNTNGTEKIQTTNISGYSTIVITVEFTKL